MALGSQRAFQERGSAVRHIRWYDQAHSSVRIRRALTCSQGPRPLHRFHRQRSDRRRTPEDSRCRGGREDREHPDQPGDADNHLRERGLLRQSRSYPQLTFHSRPCGSRVEARRTGRGPHDRRRHPARHVQRRQSFGVRHEPGRGYRRSPRRRQTTVERGDWGASPGTWPPRTGGPILGGKKVDLELEIEGEPRGVSDAGDVRVQRAGPRSRPFSRS